MVTRTGLHHVAMNVHSLKETIAFYEAIGCSFVRAWPADAPKSAMVDCGGLCLEFFENDEGDPEAAAVLPHFAFRSDDVDGDYERALSLGAKPRTEPKDVALPSDPVLNARIAFVYGINGEVIEFFNEKE